MSRYEEFLEDLARMSQDAKSSLKIETNCRNASNPCGTSCGSNRGQANYQPCADSPYPFSQDTSGQQRNGSSAQPNRQRVPCIDREALRSSLGSPLRGAGRVKNTASNRRAERAEMPETCSRRGQDRPSNLKATAESCYYSGRPLNLSDFARSRVGQGPSHSYYDSGRPLEFSDFPKDTNRSTAAQCSSNSYNTSGRAVNLSDFAGGRGESSQPPSDGYNISGRPCNLEDFGDGIPDIRIQSEPYADCGRTLNLSEFDGGPATRLRNAYSASGQGGGQYLEVPREQFGGDLSRSWQVMSDPCFPNEQPERDLVQCSARPQEQAQITEGCSNIYPSAEYQRDECPAPSCGRNNACPEDPYECLRLSQEQLVQYLQSGNVNHIFAANPPRSPLFNAFVKDTYYPGAIDDAVNGRIDFNRIAFDSVFNGKSIPKEIDAEDEPMSLLEAFQLRIQYEKDLQEMFKGQKASGKEYEKEFQVNQKKDGIPPEETPFRIHRDELKLASTADIDLMSNIRDYPETGLTQALDCLLKAEKINDFDKNVHLAEKTMVPPFPHGTGQSQSSFKADIQKNEAKFNRTYNPIEIISYVGTTKPSE